MPQKTFHFADRLIEAIQKKGTPICIGLDPRLDQIPEFIKQEKIAKKGRSFEAAAESFLEFNKGIIDAVHDLVPVVKPQIAFYEQYGFSGVRAFEETCRYAQEKGLIVIADAKRGDIDTTAEAYAKAFLGHVDLFGEKVSSLDADAMTIAPYFGFDGIKPFIDECKKHGKGIFILVKTSNKSSGDLQDRMTTDVFKGESPLKMYEVLAHLIESWGMDEIGHHGYTSIGAVVGATFPKEAAVLRKLMPHSFFLVPGYGAQGATAKDVKVCFNKDFLGAIVNSSRDIIFAFKKSEKYSEKNYKDATREAVLQMKNDLSEIFEK